MKYDLEKLNNAVQDLLPRSVQVEYTEQVPVIMQGLKRPKSPPCMTSALAWDFHWCTTRGSDSQFMNEIY